jgi:hypothetical protein
MKAPVALHTGRISRDKSAFLLFLGDEQISQAKRGELTNLGEILEFLYISAKRLMRIFHCFCASSVMTVIQNA